MDSIERAMLDDGIIVDPNSSLEELEKSEQQAPLVMPSAHGADHIEVMWFDDESPIIVGIHGCLGVSEVNSIDEELQSGAVDFEDGEGTYLFNVRFKPMEIGDNGGVIEDAHWCFEQLKYEPSEA